MILSVLRHADGHLTAGEIYDQVRVEYPYVDVSTVYRTLAVLKDLRLVAETDMGTGETTYEWLRKQGRHHHLICRACGQVGLLDDRFLDSLGTQITADSGFHPDIDHVAFFGLCRECASAQPTTAVA
jgi:Fur family ferric uptake transcriptional regulator